MTIIEESGMQFGEYPDETIFHIEKSPQYMDHLMPNGIKSCEFILKKNNILYFIEAKLRVPIRL